MKYFIDTEFIESFHKPLFGKRRHFIDLISIGIIAEDGREYYAISNEFNPKDADGWVKENVIANLSEKAHPKNGLSEYSAWKSNKQIAKDIILFVYNDMPPIHGDIVQVSGKLPDQISTKIIPEFYGYYAGYDWVLFCSLFGTMMDLPRGFPMYCRDLKQIIDEKAASDILRKAGNFSFDTALRWIQNDPRFPKQNQEHNALSDAKWNKKLYEFLKAV